MNDTEEEGWPSAVRAVGAGVCIVFVVAALAGNALVLIVVAKFRSMRSVTNVLLASLAAADFTVAALVMPLLVLYDLQRRWPLGALACHLWISCDVMCCTASILHLLVIALDRFLAITRPLRYRGCVSRRRVTLAIVAVWSASAAISFIPIFSGWYSDGPVQLTGPAPDCSLKVNRIYALVSSATSFYLPLPVMFYVYSRILVVAERQTREIRQLERHALDARARTSLADRSRQALSETRAVRTLGIIMGIFCVCWLPFFLMYVILAYCPDCYLPYEVRSSLTWLGYFNSAFNPFVYAYFNRDFRAGFRKILFGCHGDKLTGKKKPSDDAETCWATAPTGYF